MPSRGHLRISHGDARACTPATGCPDRGLLINFDLGKLSADDLEAVALHIASCPSCEQSLHALHGREDEDSVVGRLKQTLGRAPFLDRAYGAPTVTSSGTVPIDAFASTLEAWTVEGHRKALEATHRYELLGKIGQGGMGVVYRARQVALKRTVALKMILAGPDAKRQTVARFLREGKVVARLRHPNIVQVYDLDQSEGLPYFSMELVEGRDLKQRLADGPFALREAAELVRTLAEAIEYAHRENVLHRDLKPANILLAEDGTPKITDFGLAKWLDAESGEHTSAALTEAESILGSPSYMAPEQAEGRSADTCRATDVYALGAILYELLTGRPPFVGATKLQTMELVRTAEPVPPSRHRPGIPPWLEAICLKCLEKSPGAPLSHGEALADDLGRWLNDERPEGSRAGSRGSAGACGGTRRPSLIGPAMFSAGTAYYLFVFAPERAIRQDRGRAGPRAARHADREDGGTEVVPLADREIGEPVDPRRGRHAQRPILVGGTAGARARSPVRELSIRRAGPPRYEREMRGDVGLYFARKAYPGDRTRHPVLHARRLQCRPGGRGPQGEGRHAPREHQAPEATREESREVDAPACSRTRRCTRTPTGESGVADGPRFEPLGRVEWPLA